MVALGAIHGAQDMGLQVPHDLAVVGYDDREFTSFFRPSITTVSLPSHEMGVASAQLLLTFLQGEIQSSTPIEVPGRLIVRESCGAKLVR
jgi:DNA-binding LacI/PurR family transcriptional regulator